MTGGKQRKEGEAIAGKEGAYGTETAATVSPYLKQFGQFWQGAAAGGPQLQIVAGPLAARIEEQAGPLEREAMNMPEPQRSQRLRDIRMWKYQAKTGLYSNLQAQANQQLQNVWGAGTGAAANLWGQSASDWFKAAQQANFLTPLMEAIGGAGSRALGGYMQGRAMRGSGWPVMGQDTDTDVKQS